MGNPRGLDGVFNCQLAGNNYRYHERLHAIIREIDPDVMVGVGWIAAYILKLADPARKLIYMTTGCEWIKMYAGLKRTNDFLSFSQNSLSHPERITGRHTLERRTIELADFVLTHSDMNLQLHRTLYASSAGKMYDNVVWFSDWIYQDALQYQHLARPFEARDIDALFIANDWSRPEKNYWLAKKIIARLPDLNVHVVGEVRERLPGITFHDFISERSVVFELMANTKAVVSPSSFDTAPGILFEASAMGCNVVTSKNCGNWQLCHPDLLVDAVGVQAFVNCVRLAATKEYEDNIAFFHDTHSYDDLKNLLAVF